MIFVSVMRKIKSCHIHTGFTKSGYYLFGLTCGADGTYYFCFAHIKPPKKMPALYTKTRKCKEQA